jgi:hypothetical protein
MRRGAIAPGFLARLSTSETDAQRLNEVLSKSFHEVKTKTSPVIFGLP